MTEANSTVGTLACLRDLALIRVSGPDRITFLQGQLTNDVTRLGDTLMTAGYCSPKGRLLATPRLFADGDSVLMIVTACQAAALVKRLKMYVLRSKVTVDLDTTHEIFGYTGAVPDILPSEAFVFDLGTPAAATCVAAAVPQRHGLIIAPSGTLTSTVTSVQWWAVSAAAGEPWIFALSADRFTPHAINLDLVRGISFNKGCYTGQEVVSRIEHIGKTNRRMVLFAANKPLSLAVDGDVTDVAGAVLGTVVYAVSMADRTLILMEVPTALCEITEPVESSLATLYRLALPYGWSRTE